MKQPKKSFRDLILLSGWLFADLLLALTMLFLIANTSSFVASPKLTATPTSTPTILKLEAHPYTIKLHVDYQGLLNNSPSAISDVKQQIRIQPFLQGRNAGFVIAFGGAKDNNGISIALQVSQKVLDILRSLGDQNFVFSKAVYYSPLYISGQTPSNVEIQLYLYA